MLCLIYTLVFVYAFSTFANFGILTRERVMVLPFVLVLFALPKPVGAQPSTSTSLREHEEASR